MVRQAISQEFWGRAHQQNGDFPCVKAYFGSLPPNADGVEFETDFPPSSVVPLQGGPVFWYADSGHALPCADNPELCYITGRFTLVRYLRAANLQSGIDLSFAHVDILI